MRSRRVKASLAKKFLSAFDRFMEGPTTHFP